MEKTHHVAEYKKKIVADIIKYVKEYPIIGLVNMKNLPAPQLQAMKAKLRDKVCLFMTKKRLMKIALGQVKNDKKGIEELEKYFQGMPALLFTKDSPFKLSKSLQQSKSPAPAKAGQIAPKDIIIPKGPTSFSPGPIISELGSIGIKTGVESGKVAVKEDSLVAKKGEKIKSKVAEVLTRMGIEPMEVGLDLVAAYENGLIYPKDVLLIDEKEFMNKLNSACLGAFNLAVFIEYTTKETIGVLLGKAFNDAKAIGLSQNIIDSGIIEELLGKAERSMLSLKSAANIEVQEKEEVVEKEIKEEKPIEKKKEVKEIEEEKPKVEEKKEEAKLGVEEKPEVKKEEPQVEEKKEEVEEEPKIEEKEAEKEEDIYEEESREELIEEGEISPREEGFMEGYEEAGKTEEEKKEEKAVSEVDKKVKDMVEETKKFIAGEKGPTAEALLKEAEKEERKEEVEVKKKRKEVPSAHELAKEKKEDEKKEIEDLTQELIKKGSLRKK